MDKELKLKTIDEYLVKLEKDICTCEGEMFLCNRCAMISDIRDEKIKLEGGE